MDQNRVDGFIGRLLDARTWPPPHTGKYPKYVEFREDEIRDVCSDVREIFMRQPMLLELEAPLKICGDVHGQYWDLLRIFEFGGFPPDSSYLFLGDFVDRGQHGIECILLLFCYKIKYPVNFFLLRGNHECAWVNKEYGFYEEVKRRYSIRLWKTMVDVFNCMPCVAIIEDKIFCCHGGISPELLSLDQIHRIARPTDIPDAGLLCDLLWSDPDPDVIVAGGWAENDRGVSYTFGKEAVSKFLKRFGLDLICRAHQVVQDGYNFDFDRRVVTVFSAPNYQNMDNAGGIMTVDEQLMCSFKILKPTVDKKSPKGAKPSSSSRNSRNKGKNASGNNEFGSCGSGDALLESDDSDDNDAFPTWPRRRSSSLDLDRLDSLVAKPYVMRSKSLVALPPIKMKPGPFKIESLAQMKRSSGSGAAAWRKHVLA